ncbi:MAG: hypothetical protein WCJ66_08980 [Verrucomicrobiota bacterium]
MQITTWKTHPFFLTLAIGMAACAGAQTIIRANTLVTVSDPNTYFGGGVH